MDVAIVLLGIAGTLGGTWLGARLSTRQTERSESLRRADADAARQRQVQSAARLVHSEIGLAGLLLQSSARDGSLLGMGLARTEAWTAHGALLAAELPDDVHGIVAEVCTKLAVVVTATGNLGTAEAASAPGHIIERLVDHTRQAQMALAPYAYPTGDPADFFFVRQSDEPQHPEAPAD